MLYYNLWTTPQNYLGYSSCLNIGLLNAHFWAENWLDNLSYLNNL